MKFRNTGPTKMKRLFAVLLALSVLPVINAARAGSEGRVVPCNESEEESWVFRSSYFSHDPDKGNRVAQYAPEPTSYYRDDPSYMESGYRHYQYEIVGPGGSADRMHVVQTWGLGLMLRPYGEWEYPYRAGATPYGPWGNPQGPWTLPFQSWENPYGLMQHLPTPGWNVGPSPYGLGTGSPYGGSAAPGNGMGAGNGYGQGPGIGYGP
jgi:hypothetical protein